MLKFYEHFLSSKLIFIIFFCYPNLKGFSQVSSQVTSKAEFIKSFVSPSWKSYHSSIYTVRTLAYLCSNDLDTFGSFSFHTESAHALYMYVTKEARLVMPLWRRWIIDRCSKTTPDTREYFASRRQARSLNAILDVCFCSFSNNYARWL